MRRLLPQLGRLLAGVSPATCSCPAALARGTAAFHAAASSWSGRRSDGGEGGQAESWVGGGVPARLLPQRDLVPEVEGMTRKQQQFHLTELLRGRSSLRVEAAADAEQAVRSFQMQVIDVNRTVKVTKGGSLQRFSALVVVGNGDGVVGWAMGKAPEVGVAIDKAYSRAARSLFFFERFEGHTIFHDARAKYGRTLVHIAPLPSGSGLKANTTVCTASALPQLCRSFLLSAPQIAAICRLAGIKDVRAKVLGSHNPGTTLRAVFEALDSIRSPDEIAAMRGRTVICTSPTPK